MVKIKPHLDGSSEDNKNVHESLTQLSFIIVLNYLLRKMCAYYH